MAKQTKRFNYQPRDASTIKARSNQRGGDFDSIWKEGVRLFKPREGKNTIRILPPTWANADHYGFNIYVNYGIGVDNQSYLAIGSMAKEHPRLGLEARDPLAEARKEAEKDGNKKLADSLRPTKRVAFYVIDRMDEEAGVMLWAAPWTVDKAFCNRSIDVETGAVTAVDDPYEGSDIRFHFEKTGKQFPDYPADKIHVFKASPLSEDEKEANEWLDWVTEHPIPDMLNFYDYEHIAQVFEGHVVKGDDDETSKRASKTTSARRKPWEDEEEEDEKPAKRVAKGKPAGVTDDEDVDEETGEVTARKSNGNGTKTSHAEDEDDDEPVTRMSAAAIREKLRSRRPSVDED